MNRNVDDAMHTASPYRSFSAALFLCAFIAAACGANAEVPAPAPTPVAAGPCDAAALPSVALRPGIGRAPATSGAICVVAPGSVVLGAGLRDQATVGNGRQNLAVYPAPIALIGITPHTELIISPSLIFSNRRGTGGTLPAAFGQQDAGIGFQHLLADGFSTQQAIAFFATVPTGYPAGPTGFSDGAPTYTLAYTIAYVISGKIGLSTSQGVVVASGDNAAGANHRYVAYQPTLTASYALSPLTTALVQDQITAPGGPQAPTGNRALIGVQRSIGPNIMLDAEYELNVLPAPGVHQHALGAGVTARL